jgi:NTE family protein
MARVHVLRGQDRVFGFTLDEQGTNLPRQYGPWTTFKTIELHHDEPYQGVDVSVCLDDISKYGFHLTAAHKRITDLALHSAPVKGERALVLGSGGATGNAWLIGVIAGLFEAGLDVTEADLIVGTSAGLTAAAQITSATPPQLLADILAAAPQPGVGGVGSDRGGVPRPVANHMERTDAIFGAAADAADLRRRMGAAALEMDAASDSSIQMRWRAAVASRLPSQHWPERPLHIVVIDAHTGEPVVFDCHSGVELVDAVAASTANGFGVPPYSIGDKRYIDGGYPSAENADLAAGGERILVLSPFGGRSRAPLHWGVHLAAHVDELRARGSKVETIFPDSNSRDAFGVSMMDVSARPPSAQAGYNQGRALAEQLTEFWR